MLGDSTSDVNAVFEAWHMQGSVLIGAGKVSLSDAR